MTTNPIIAVDLGGTWIRCAAVGADGACGPLTRCSTGAQRPARAIVDDLAQTIETAASSSGANLFDCRGIALAVPAVLDSQGRLVESGNLPTLDGLSLPDLLADRSDLPVTQCNDGTCFAVGEQWRGAARGAQNVLGITLGTGFGLGLIIAGRPYHGSHGRAGEIWSTPWGEGRLEDHLCGPGLERRYLELTGRALSGKEVMGRADAGELDAQRVFDELGVDLGRVIAFLINTVDPDLVVLGGSVSKSFRHFIEGVRRVVSSVGAVARGVEIVPSKLGDEAGLVGAARLGYTDSTRD